MLPWPTISTAPALYLGKHIAALAVTGVLGSWYDASDLSTLFQDVAGTIPVTTPGQSIALMRDKSGLGFHLVQASPAARPILRLDALGFYHLELDGFDDVLASALTYNVGATHYIACSAMRLAATNAAIFGATLSTIRYSRLRSVGTGGRVANNYRVALGSFEAAVANSPTLVAGVIDGAASPGYLDVGWNGTVATGTTLTTAADSIPGAAMTVGNSQLRFYAGLTLHATPSAATRRIIQKYLTSKHGAVL
jgi:hypothetical protein